MDSNIDVNNVERPVLESISSSVINPVVNPVVETKSDSLLETKSEIKFLDYIF